MNHDTATLGVVIVNYQSFDLTLRCAGSLLAHRIAAPQDIVVVDNASPDDSGARLREALPEVRVLASPRNGGFGAGINFGIAALATDLVLVLNPDTYFLENRTGRIKAAFARDREVGIAGLKLLNPDGSLQYSARRFYSVFDILLRRSPLGMLPGLRTFVDSHLMRDGWTEERFAADWVMGTGFVVRRAAFEAVGRMDEGYFLYFEEVDLCARMWIEGWKALVLADVALIHDHQRESKAGLLSRLGRIHLRSMGRFFDKFGVPLFRPSIARLARGYRRWQQNWAVVWLT